MVILGLGGLLGDAACAVLKDGELKAAVEENKLDHVWKPGGLPQSSIAECLRLAGTSSDQVECFGLLEVRTGPWETKPPVTSGTVVFNLHRSDDKGRQALSGAWKIDVLIPQ